MRAAGLFASKKEEQRAPRFIERFSSAFQEHYHDESGREAGERVAAEAALARA